MKFRVGESADASPFTFGESESEPKLTTGPSSGLTVCQAVAAAALLLGSGSVAVAEAIPLPAFHVFVENCAPSVAPKIMEKLVRAESGFNQFAIGVNGATHRSYNPASKEEAARIARDLIDQGHSIDMGLGQISSENLDWLELTVESVFDSCTNLKASERVLRDGYDRARKQGSDPQTALHQALSAYNTGTFTRGFSNGYVERVMGGNVEMPPADHQPRSAESPAPEDTILTWQVFSEGAASSALVFN
ncbi:lytic transglycosylase domain-containing protein [Roseobacter litoralis]|uniref:lytic transglycosylase domain-containing protein n=1 Tax=Roseobacter litoralis TaxID=42443 RepID=UPI003CD0CDAC